MASLITFSTPAELENFKVDARPSIVTVFQQLLRKAVPIYLMVGGELVAESRVLNVDTKNNTVFLAYTSDYALNQRLQEEGGDFVAEHLSAQVQFHIPRAAQVMYQQGYVFTVSLPEQIYRIQRRDSYRAQVAGRIAVKCAVPLQGVPNSALPIWDISRGGIALLDSDNHLQVPAGGVLHNCRLDLPQIGEFKADMRVMNRHKFYYQGLDCEVARVGCQFMAMTTGMENMLQRFIDQLEYQQRNSV